MSTHLPSAAELISGELQRLRRHWFWFVVLGILLMVVGALAIARPAIAALTVMELLGVLLIIGSAVELASGIWGRTWGGFFLHLLCGWLYLFLGVFIIERPGETVAVYTFLLAIFFVAIGAARLAYAVSHRFEGRGWAILNGFITFALGVMIWRQYPTSAVWVIGTFVGIEMIFNGISWFMLGLSMKSMPVHNSPAV